jgi:DnaK suppressor protein
MAATTTSPRTENARRILEEHRAALATDLRHDIRDAHAGIETVQPDNASDDLDAVAVMAQSDIRFSVMHIKGELLVMVNGALAAIGEGCYGICASCGSNISDARLRALPSALRCMPCEEQKEDAELVRMRVSDPVHRLAKRLR